MHRHYRDILSRIRQEPVWFDENAVPRFCEFSPSETANIYAQEVAFVLISCQGCGRDFRVAFTEMNLRNKLWNKKNHKIKNISDLIEDGSIHYGDPPNIKCCPAGPTMNSIPVRVIEYWFKPIIRGEGLKNGLVEDMQAMRFRRDPRLEIKIKSGSDPDAAIFDEWQ